VARSLDPSTLDPQTGVSGDDHQYWYAFFNNLVAYDKEAVLQTSMSLAEKWEVVNPTTIRLDLRKGVTFQDGTPFNADAAIWNLNRVLDPSTKSTERGAMSVIQRIDKLDDYSIRLNLKNPSGSLLTSMGDRGGAMVSPTAVQAMGDKFGQKPVGTGPWQVTNWTPAQVVSGDRFKNYWKKDLPYFDKLNIRVIPDSTVAFSSLLTSEIDLVALAPTDVGRAQADPKLKVVRRGAGATSIFTNQTKTPMDNLKVRQAIVAALDPEAINKVVFLGLNIPGTGGYWPPQVWTYKKLFDKWPTDVAKAKQLLTEAGFPQGVSLEMMVYSAPTNIQYGETIQQQLARAGIKVNITVRDVGAATNGFYTQPKGPEGSYHLYAAGFSLRADPNGNAGIHMHRSGFYNRWLPDPEEDALVEKAASLYDQSERKKLYDQIQQINWDKVNDIWPTYSVAFAGLRAEIQGEDTVFGGESKFRYEWLWRK
jgi:peptide/nickel transport system substrate-binding protein